MKRPLKSNLNFLPTSPLAAGTSLVMLFPLIFLPPKQPVDSTLMWVILAAIIIILILVIVVLVLLYSLRKQAATEAGDDTPSQADIVTQVSNRSAESDEATLPSMNREAAIADLDEPTLPSATVDDVLDKTQPSMPQGLIIGEVSTQPVSGQRPSNINWEIAGLTHVGMKREMNEDKLLMLETATESQSACGLYIVADGMGGHEHGEIASGLTITAIQNQFDQASFSDTAYDEWLSTAIYAANDAVITHQTDKNIEKKMGSTLVMALVVDGQAHIANVGDSRAYYLNETVIKQISVDHSLVERLIEIGQITREEARTHKQRNVIYSTVGDSKAKLQIGLYNVDVKPGDRLMLCSDGLSGMLTDEQILNISRSHASPAEACQMLVKAANAAGGDDNITAILIEMGSA